MRKFPILFPWIRRIAAVNAGQLRGLAPAGLPRCECIRGRVVEILDALPVNETFDWVPQVSVELTGRMLATVLGVPQEDRDKLIRWSNAISNADNPEYTSSAAGFYETLAEMGDYFSAIWEERKAAEGPGDDLISMLAWGQHTAQMDRKQLLGNMLLLMVGGNDTTRNSITGGLLALNQFPEQYAKLRANPELIPSGGGDHPLADAAGLNAPYRC